jgi:hypothetical protein
MKSATLAALLLLAFAASAQAPATAPVALKNEPHHHLVLENDYVRLWAFGIKGHDTTLVHEHALPYLGITLGPAEFVNAVTGKPEVHAKQVDGQISYSKGGFSHLVRTEGDVPFRNFTIELLKTQGAPRNRCVKVIADGALDCPQGSASPLDAAAPPALETDEILLREGAISTPLRLAGEDAQPARLVCALEQSELSVEIAGQPAKKLHGGEAAWLPAGAVVSLGKPGAAEARFVMISFKDSAPKS